MEARRLDAEKVGRAKEVVEVATQLIDLSHRAYAALGPSMRRRYNQAFFEAVYVEDRQAARVAYKEPFEGLLTSGFSKTPLVHPSGQYSKKYPQVEGHVLRLSDRHAKLRREGYRKREHR